MKRLTLLGILILFTSINIEAQLRLGLRGGINTAYFSAKEILTDDFRLNMHNDASVGFHGGFMMQVSFFGIFIQPELLLSSINSEVMVSDLQAGGLMDQIKEQKYTKLDFPVLIGKRFGPARVGVGPVGTIVLGTKSELKQFGFKEHFNSATFGYQAGVGLDIFKRLALDIKYEGNLSKLGSGITVGGEKRKFDSRSRQFIVSLGIFL